MAASDPSFVQSLVSAGGATGRLIAEFDWAPTPLGPIATWPQSLRVALGIVLRSPVPIVMLWGEPGIMLYNDGYSGFAGGRHPKLLGSEVRKGWPEVADFNDHVMRVGLAGGTLAYKDQQLTLERNGAPEPVWMNLDYSPVPDETGKPAGVIAIVVETTERVLAERRAAAERERLTRMYEQAPTFMGMLEGPEHRFVLANPALLRLVGRSDIVGKTFAEALPDAVQQGFLDRLDHALRTGEAINAVGASYVVEPVPGQPTSERFVDYVYQPITDSHGAVRGIFIEGSDVTERVTAEAALHLLNQTLERRVTEGIAERKVLADVVESTDLFIQVVDPQYRFIAVNRAAAAEFERIYGVRPYVGASMLDLFAGQPEQLAAVQAIWQRALDGEEFTEVAAFGDPAQAHWYEMRFSTLRNGEGQRIGAYQLASDVTDRLRDRARLEEAEAALSQAQKMQAVGQLAGGIAHDFNNVLQAVHGNFELIRRKPDDLERVRRWADSGRQATERGTALTSQLLAFSRMQRLEAVPVALDALLRRMQDMLVRTLGPQIRIGFELDTHDAAILSDPTQIEMAVLNLAINARDAMQHTGALTIGTRRRRIDDDVELPAGDYVELRVSDTGPGMTADVAARAFDPFFTTKAVGQGAGLGLSQVYGVAKQAGGTARTDGSVAHGASIVVTFRAADEVRSADAAPVADAPPDSRDAKVLVVDDDPDVRSFLVDSLETLGYRVAQAEDGPKGLAALDEVRPDLMLLDFAMPGMTGAEVASVARTRRPDLAIVFASGYANTAAVEAAIGSDDAMLRKPFAIEDLQAALSNALARRGARRPQAGSASTDFGSMT